MPPRLLLATRNAGKRAELQALLAGLPVTPVGPDAFGSLPDVPETAESFRGNAEAKARAYAAAAGCLALADDSGLEVDALGGAPGVRSARFAGERATDDDNNRRLLDAMRAVPAARRTARFRCVVVVADPAGRILAAADGTAEGRILEAPRGTGGFGYDPLFLSDDLRKTFAEATAEEKNRVSHRARAMAALRRPLATALAR